MQPKDPSAKAPWLETHPLSEQDSVGAAALRSAVAPMKGKVEGTAGRAVCTTTSWNGSPSRKA